MSRRPLSFWHPASLIATWFGSGLVPGIPGTWGSLAALPFAVAIAMYGGPWALLAAAGAAFAAGLWASGVYARVSGAEDPGPVVIDEVAGQWLTLVLVPVDPVLYAVGFVTFRVFDVLKPWPANYFDQNLPGAWGIMTDDIAAAVYAGAVTFGAAYLMAA